MDIMCSTPVESKAEGGVDRCRECNVRGACVASKISEEDLPALAHLLRAGETLSRGVHLFRAGDSADRQYHVRSGTIKTYIINAQGDEFVTGFYLPGDIVGTAQQAGCYSESAVALDTATLCEAALSEIQEYVTPGIALALIRQMCERATDNLAQRISLSQGAAQARFAAFCVNYSDKLRKLGRCEKFLPTPMSRTDLANHLGMSLECLSRVVSKLNTSRTIHAARDHLELLELETIRTLALHSTI